MNKLVEEYLTRAITERFEESLKEPDKCHKARDEVINASLKEYRQHKGYGVSRETLAKALEMAIVDLEAARSQLRTCETCDGDGIMSAVVGFNPPGEELLEDVECAECHGTGVSSWGQAIDRAEKAEKKLKEALAAHDHVCRELRAREAQGVLVELTSELDVEVKAGSTRPEENLNMDGLKDRCMRLEAQLTAEEECAMNSGGILSDVCDLVFDDPERAATHGYEGVRNRIAQIKNQLRLYQIQVSKYCADFCPETKGETGPCFTCPLGKS